MNTTLRQYLIVIIGASIVQAFLSCIDYFPWWGFTIGLVILGIVITYNNNSLPLFKLGFVSGFIVWSIANFYFDIKGEGILLKKTADLFTINKTLLIMISGIIGGYVSGLSLYLAKLITTLILFYKNDSSN